MVCGKEAEIIATSANQIVPWRNRRYKNAVLYSPDPPFLFGGGSGYKTNTVQDLFMHVQHL